MCRRFDKICAGGEERFCRFCEGSSSEWALSCGDGGVEVGCNMTPTPSLLAEPSRPIAIGILKAQCGSLVLVVTLVRVLSLISLGHQVRSASM